MTSDWKGPLGNIRVLDFTRVLAGPFATQLLGDLGADIVKIEAPGKGDDTRHFPPFLGELSHYFIALNRSKRSIVLDLRKPEAIEIVRRMAATADVVIENFRPGVMDRLGLGYAALAAINPRIVYCAISGFGATGPMSDKPSFDIVTQALSGAMSVNGEPGQPPVKLGLPLGDMVGGIYGSIGVLAALNERNETGRGRKIDLSLLDGLMGMLGYLAQLYFVNGTSPAPVGTRHPNLVPYGAFKASDGYIIVACLTEEFWKNLARAIGQPDLPADERFRDYPSRLKHRDALDAIVQAAIGARPVAEWLKILDENDVPHAPILSVGQALEHPNTTARGMVETVTHPVVGEMRLVGRPIRYEGAPQAPLTPPPLLGEHGAAILRELLDMPDAEIERLQAAGVVVPQGAGR